MKSNKSEAILIRNRGGKLVEIRLFPPSTKQGNSHLSSDGIVVGSMETRTLPKQYTSFLEWLEQNGKLELLEKMIKHLFQ